MVRTIIWRISFANFAFSLRFFPNPSAQLWQTLSCGSRARCMAMRYVYTICAPLYEIVLFSLPSAWQLSPFSRLCSRWSCVCVLCDALYHLLATRRSSRAACVIACSIRGSPLANGCAREHPAGENSNDDGYAKCSPSASSEHYPHATCIYTPRVHDCGRVVNPSRRVCYRVHCYTKCSPSAILIPRRALYRSCALCMYAFA